MRELQIKISLANSHIPIWRRFLITDDYRLDRFHQVLQIVMGWWNAHLHEFDIGGRKFGMNIGVDYAEQLVEEETKFYLKHFPFEVGYIFHYVYDFGDNWQHDLVIESVKEISKNKSGLKCIAGEGGCPYEDAGGVGGYQYMLEAMYDAKHPEHRQFIGDSWIEDLPDPTFFDLKETSRELRKFSLWHNKHPRRKSTPWHQVSG